VQQNKFDKIVEKETAKQDVFEKKEGQQENKLDKIVKVTKNCGNGLQATAPASVSSRARLARGSISRSSSFDKIVGSPTLPLSYAPEFLPKDARLEKQG